MTNIDICHWGSKPEMDGRVIPYLICGKSAKKWIMVDSWPDSEVYGLCKKHMDQRMATHRTLVSIVDDFAPVTTLQEITRNEAMIWEIMGV